MKGLIENAKKQVGNERTNRGKKTTERERKYKLKIEKIANESTSENEIIIGEKKLRKN